MSILFPNQRSTEGRWGAAARLIAALALAVTPACSSSDNGSSSGTDASTDGATHDGSTSNDADAVADTGCTKPGDPGNSLGVGKYCDLLGDCSDTVDAHICATLGDPTAHFCTKTCTRPDAGGDASSDASETGADGGVGECGENATCACDTAGCGCTPNVCL
jgi:hypothetical protein